MKKLFMLVALMFGLASCQNEPEDLNVVVGGEQDVMLTVSLPESTRGASSAGFDFTNFESNSKYDLRFILEISYNGKVVREVKTTETTSATFPVRLAPEKTYKFTVWADLVNEGSNADLFYNTTDGLSNIKINLDKWTPNVEARDAYTLTMEKVFNAAADLSMELKRPFAKVRVVATDIKKVTDFDLNPTSAVASYSKQMYTSFNALTGEKAGLANVEHSFKYAEVDKYADKDGERTVFADYIFVPEDNTVQFTLNIYADEAQSNLINDNAFNTPIYVEKNKVTSIVGDVLTEGGNVKVTVDSTLGEKETINYVNSANSLQETINKIEDGKSGNVKLGGNIDLGNIISIGTLSTRAAEPTYGLLIPADKSVVIDLNGFTISQSKTQTAAYSMIENLGTLTIKDDSANKTGKISYADNGQGGNYVSNTIHNSGVLTIEGGIVENNSSATVASNGYPHPIDNSGTLVINGGTFTNNANYSSMRIWCTTDDDTIVTIIGGTFNGSIDFQTPSAAANKGTLTIKGGTFNADTYTKCAVRLLGFGADVDEMNGYILGGHFNGAIALKNWSGSELNSKVFDITGGIFTTEAKEGTAAALINDDYAWVEADGLWTLKRKPTIAKIGDDEYTSLIKAIAAVQDGDTITLVANEEFTENNRSNNSGYWDGVAYSGDKSFTIDLGGNTVSQNGALNDYLFWIKNDGSKANTITIKNGTLDAGTSAYCALCTSTTSTAKITINLENVNLVGNNFNGGVAKIRGGAELNVKAGTVITGYDNYVGIECVNATTNIYEGAKIYQNGTSSYAGSLAGVSNGGVLNVYGGEGTSAKGGFIAMTSGGTINVYGGNWIANTDGAYANSNNSVLIAQSAKGAKSVINVTGGTFKGGYNCYGDKAGDAQINIKGGNFNANPASYVAKGYGATENNGIWAVSKAYEITEVGATIYSAAGMFWFANEVNVNGNSFSGKTVKLANDIDLKNAAWTPIGQTGATTFNGVFDGENYTISNLNVNSEAQTGANYSSGLFGWVESHTAGHGHLKNVKIEGATINGHHNCGALVGYITQETALVENCHVTGANVTCTKANDDADGDKAGALIGNATVATPVKNCTAANSTVSAGRDAGQIIGAGKEANVTGCSATNVAVSANGTSTGKNIRNEVIGRLL